MLGHKIIYILLLTILGLLIFYRKKPDKIEYFLNKANNLIKENIVEKYTNNLTDSLECNLKAEKKNNKEIIQYINKNYELYKKYNEEKEFGIETSTKFSKKSINFERVAFFAHFSVLKNNEGLKKEILDEINSNKNDPNAIKLIEDNLNKNIDKDGQLIFGKDFKNNYKRVYINYKDTNEYKMDGYEMKDNYYNHKNYTYLRNTSNIIKTLSELFGNYVSDMIINLFPEDNWDVLLEKSDSKIDINHSKGNSYYISFKIDPILRNIYQKLKELLLYINSDEKLIEDWYECNKNNSISWITLNKNSLNEIEFNIYFVTSNNNMIRLKESMDKFFEARNKLKILDIPKLDIKTKF
tara:strand:- start:1472 stop:2530 length:1059 start_codon:yes stop_codon:yes gene_type:complete